MHQSAADGGDGAGNIVVWQKFKWNRRDRGSDRFRHRLYTPGFSECRRNHPDFKSVGSDDTSRQRADPFPAENGETSFLGAPSGYFLGTEFTRAVIDRALEQTTERERFALCPSRDISGHGTHVTGIAAGNGRASQGRYRGVAYESPLLIVKLGTPGERSFPRTTELMQAVDYCIRKAQEYGMPIVINLSFGNNYGSHSGNSLLESYLDDMANYWRTSIVAGSGNEGRRRCMRLECGKISRKMWKSP